MDESVAKKKMDQPQTGMMAWPAGSQKWILALTSRTSEFDFSTLQDLILNQK